MDFTREPIIESVVTPREGCKLAVRSSKSSGQEEYFVDAVEIVSFGHSFFFRSLERPKAFLVPVSDYEILEVREARMVLKNVGIDRAIKIGGGRDAQMRNVREQMVEKTETASAAEEYGVEAAAGQQPVPAGEEAKPEARIEKKRDRRRHYRRRRGREEGTDEVREPEAVPSTQHVELAEPRPFTEEEAISQPMTTTSFLTSLLPPPQTLISETIARYKDNALFRGAFYAKEEKNTSEEEERKSEEEQKSAEDVERQPGIPLEPPAYGSFELSEEEEERIYQQRKQMQPYEDEHAKKSESDIFPAPLQRENGTPSEEEL